MIRIWASIAFKLCISQEEALLLHGLLRNWLNPLAKRRAYVVVSDIVERFQLDARAYEMTYAQQLLDLKILTPTEAEVFAGDYNENSTPKRDAHPGTGTAPADRDGPGE